jgi:hypothetical protein
MVSRSPVPEAAPQIALPWIIRLRYGMMLEQILTAIVVHFLLKIDLPLFWIALGPALVGCSNLLLAARVSDPDSPAGSRPRRANVTPAKAKSAHKATPAKKAPKGRTIAEAAAEDAHGKKEGGLGAGDRVRHG